MANKIKLKRGTSTPTTSDIVDGEVAIDKSAQKLYVNDGGTIKEIGGGSSSGIADGAVTTAKLADDAVTQAKIADDAVNSDQIADDAVNSAKLSANSVDNNALQSLSVTAAKIAAGEVTEAKIANLNITTGKIADDAVTYSKIQNVSATDRILGRDSSGAGSIEEITPANVRTMLNVEDGATADQTKSDIDALGIAASTATTLATARTIAGVSFDGSANISLNNNNITNGAGYITSATNNFVSSASFSGGTLTLGRSGLSNLTVSGIGTSTFSGSYNDLSSKPTIPTNNNQLTNGAGYITSQQTNAGALSSGTLANARLPSTIDVSTLEAVNFHDSAASAGTLSSAGWSAYRSGSGFEAVTIVKSSSGYGTALFINRLASAGTGNIGEFQYNGGFVGSINTNGSGVSYNSSSDYRLKQDINSITDATTKLKALNPVNFKWINNTDKFVTGFIAHEVQETGYFDDLVTGTKDGTRTKYDDSSITEPDYQTIDYGKFTPMLIAAFKELEARVTALESS